MLRAMRIASGVSDVLKTCVDKPKSQEEPDESAREGDRNGSPDRGADPVADRRSQDQRDNDHQASTGGFGSGHGEVDPYALKAEKIPAWWSAGGKSRSAQRQDGAI
jgi:hypothetical protein